VCAEAICNRTMNSIPSAMKIYEQVLIVFQPSLQLCYAAIIDDEGRRESRGLYAERTDRAD